MAQYCNRYFEKLIRKPASVIVQYGDVLVLIHNFVQICYHTQHLQPGTQQFYI